MTAPTASLFDHHSTAAADQPARTTVPDREAFGGAAVILDRSSPGASEMLVTLAGRRLLTPDGTLLAELDGRDQWRTSGGLLCEALMIPAPRASAYVAAAEVTRAAREADLIWREAAVEKIAWLAERKAEITADDLWEHIEHPPRESRLVGHAFKRAQAQGLIQATERYQRSRRAMNHTRRILIWRSLHPAAR